MSKSSVSNRRWIFVCVFMCLSTSCYSTDSMAPNRVRRNLWQFRNMVQCTTGKNALDFVGYGCHCGYGGSGTPVDHIDRCCQEHDLCYDRTVDKNQCPSVFTYVVDYLYEASGCGTVNAAIYCNPAKSYPWIRVDEVCAAEICECDRTAAFCFSRGFVNQAYKNYETSSCNT